ncbi:MAG: SRPBCC family protein [Rhizobiales bacterium]|nr:SRPBCC family protein [Hyphomicrobiales bacterium]
MPYDLSFHRVLKAPVARVYKAFIDPAALCKWIAPAGYTCAVHKLEPKVDGAFRMSFTEFDSGSEMGFGGTYLEMEPNKKLRYTDVFDDPNLPGEIMVTVLFESVSCGTDIKITQQNLPGIIPPEMCELGWRDSLSQLQQFVEVLALPS